MKNVHVCSEESQRVALAFLTKGCNAFSCDLLPPSGGRMDRHVLGDCFDLLSKQSFCTMDDVCHFVDKWDLIIAHQPCTRLCSSGQRWFSPECSMLRSCTPLGVARTMADQWSPLP